MTSMKERMLAGELYHADDPELAADLARAADLMERFNATRATEAQLRADLLGELLGSVAADVQIRPPFYCDYGRYISIGAGSFLNFGVTLLDVAPITIGRNVQFGPHVQVLTPTHPVEPEPRRAGWEAAKPIVIGDNVWLGGGAIVLAGVTIGADTVVGAGAVVTRDLPPGVVAVGSPARVIRTVS